MASITVKNIPDDLRLRLKQQAKKQGRSLNQEIILRLQASTTRAPTPEEIEAELAEDRDFRERLAATGYWITPEEVEERIQEGRKR